MPSSTLRLQARLDAPRQARHHLEQVCSDLQPEVRDDACLILSELVTNAVVHARTAVTISIECDDHCVGVAVTDGSTHMPRRRTPDSMQEGGRGLLLLDELATCWGQDHTSDGAGKVIWFRIRH